MPYLEEDDEIITNLELENEVDIDLTNYDLHVEEDVEIILDNDNSKVLHADDYKFNQSLEKHGGYELKAF